MKKNAQSRKQQLQARSQAKRFEARRRAVLKETRTAQKEVDAFLVTNPFDIRYLCGAVEGVQALLFGADWCVAFIRRMFQHVLADQCPGVELFCVDGRNGSTGYTEELAARLKKHHVKRLGFSEDDMNLALYKQLCQRVPQKKWVGFSGIVSKVRGVKDEEEIELTRRAIQIAEKAFLELLALGAEWLVGRTEREVAAELEYRMRLLGADRQAFQENNIIVAFGENSASCHHIPTERRAGTAEPLLFDWGAEVDGYRSDLTRVVFVKEVPSKFQEIYSVVQQAQAAAMKRIRPGISYSAVYKAAFEVIDQAGYGEHFPHGLGHGFGLQIHEPPFLSKNQNDRLRKNMLVTVEPGIYLEGVGGVRLENDLLVTSNGYKNLSTLPTDLKKMILV